MQAWIWTITPSLFVCCAAKSHQRLIIFFELFKVLRSISTLWALGFASLCSITPQSAARIEQNTAFSWSYGLLVMAIGYWRLGMVYGLEHVALPLFIPLTFRLIAHSLPKADAGSI
ncbi:MAG: hypothetical protein E7075_02970 [Bacteroidales bacterium]|nr:hypothetical protein [Bacteroidales bacterium]